MPLADRLHFAVISLMHNTLYSLFRDPYKALDAAGLRPGQTVLEVGCGPGFFTVPAAKIVGRRGKVYALDISPLAIERTRGKVEQSGVNNVEFLLADAAQTGLPAGSIDLAFLFGFAHRKGSLSTILDELHRVLKPGGVLAIEGPLQPSAELFAPLSPYGRISLFAPS